MNWRPPIHRERGAVSFALYAYPFEATNVAPGQGGSNIDEIHIDGHGVEIAQRDYPSDWNMVCEDDLWWITLDDSWLQNRDLKIPSNTTAYELEFLVTALNLCVDTKVFFTRFARREYQGIIRDGEPISPTSGIQLGEVLQRSIPEKVVIDGKEFTAVLDQMFDEILQGEDHTDLTKAIESYRAAIQSFNTEVHVRLFYSVCENTLFTGYKSGQEKDPKIAEISSLTEEEAEAWRHLVDRTKHPDEGTPHSWEQTFEDVPPPVELHMREAANNSIRSQL